MTTPLLTFFTSFIFIKSIFVSIGVEHMIGKLADGNPLVGVRAVSLVKRKLMVKVTYTTDVFDTVPLSQDSRKGHHLVQGLQEH